VLAKELSILLAFAAPYRRVLVLGGVLMLLESSVSLAIPWVGGHFAGALLAGDALGWSVPVVMSSLVALFAAQALFKFGNAYLLGGAVTRIDADLRARVYDHLQALPMSFFQQRRHAETMSLYTRDVWLVSQYLSGTLVAVVPLLLTVGGAVVLMLRLQPVLALLTVVVIPAFFLLLKLVSRRLRPLSAELDEAYLGALAIAEENLGMLQAIKAFSREPQESKRHGLQLRRIVDLTARQLRIQASIGPAAQFIAALAIVLLLWLGSRFLLVRAMTPAQLVSLLLYAQLLARPVAGLANVHGRTQGARIALRRLLGALNEHPEPPSDLGAILPPIRGDIAFEGVSFAYPDRPPALRRIDLRIAAGETVGLTGPNGAGKSTLGHLLTRLHEPTEGRITIDGIDIATVSLHSLRGQIGVVPQHVLLFHTSVRDNIAFGRPEATDAEVEAAARAARAHDFVVALPQGYDTVVGDRGVRLSGGQQQRLALARAILKDPRILILDEATAMFDPDGEREFLEGCRTLLEGRTVILITHRPGPLALADRAIRLEGGHVGIAS
jgi:ATP-binding cassette subfamily B protein